MAEWMTTVDDVQPAYDGDDWSTVSGKADFWLPKVLARAKTVAPCLKSPENLPEEVQEAAKGIIAGAVLRLLDPNGNIVTDTTGPHSMTVETKFRSDRILSIPDRDELRSLCRSASRRRRGGTIRTPIGY